MKDLYLLVSIVDEINDEVISSHVRVTVQDDQDDEEIMSLIVDHLNSYDQS